MGMIADIKNAIFGSNRGGSGRSDEAYPGEKAVAPDVATSFDNPAMQDIAAGGVQPISKPAAMEQAQNPAISPVESDVAEVLDRAARNRGENLEWRHSLTDLMRLVGMEGSQHERAQLAKELNYEGDTRDAAATDAFLHSALLQRIADGGGRIPRDFLH